MNHSISQYNNEPKLVDIRTVSVAKDLPKAERLRDFVHQIGNPYRFACGEFTVNASFANNGVSLEERLQGVIK